MTTTTPENNESPARIAIDNQLIGEQTEAFLARVDALTQKGVRRLVIDCGGVSFLSTPGISALVSAHCRLKKLGGTIQLSGLHPRIVELFKVTRLNRLFEIVPGN